MALKFYHSLVNVGVPLVQCSSKDQQISMLQFTIVGRAPLAVYRPFSYNTSLVIVISVHSRKIAVKHGHAGVQRSDTEIGRCTGIF